MDDTIDKQNLGMLNSIPFGLMERARGSESSSGSSGDGPADSQGQGAELQRKHRRKRKRKWKPYGEISWDEQKVLEEKETKRAYAKRDKLCAEGHPIAPYNTTQFLMADHKQMTPNVIKGEQEEESSLHRTAGELKENVNKNHEGFPTRDAGKSDKDGDYLHITNEIDSIQEYIMEDFSHLYADVHAQHLQTMTKSDLISEYLLLEKKVEGLEKKLKDTKRKHRENAVSADGMKTLLDKISQLQQQNQRLQQAEVHQVENQSIPALLIESEDGNGSTGSC